MAEIAKTFYRYSTFLQRMMELFDDGSVMYSEIESRRKHEYLPNRYYDKFVEGMNKLFESGCIDIYTEIFHHIKEKAEQDSIYKKLLEECRIKNNEIAKKFKDKTYTRKMTINSKFEDSSKKYVNKEMILLKDGKVKYMEVREDGENKEILPTDFENFIANMNELFEAGNYDIYNIVFLHIQETAKNDSLYTRLYEHCKNKMDELVNQFEEIPESSETTKKQIWKDSLKVEAQFSKDNFQKEGLELQVRGKETNNGRA